MNTRALVCCSTLPALPGSPEEFEKLCFEFGVELDGEVGAIQLLTRASHAEHGAACVYRSQRMSTLGMLAQRLQRTRLRRQCPTGSKSAPTGDATSFV